MIINKELEGGETGTPTEPELSKKFNKSRGAWGKRSKFWNHTEFWRCARATVRMYARLRAPECLTPCFPDHFQGSDFVELQSLREILEVGIIKQAISAATESDIERICLVENELPPGHRRE